MDKDQKSKTFRRISRNMFWNTVDLLTPGNPSHKYVTEVGSR